MLEKMVQVPGRYMYSTGIGVKQWHIGTMPSTFCKDLVPFGPQNHEQNAGFNRWKYGS